MNPGLLKFSGRRTKPSPPGTSGGFSRRERDQIVTEDPRNKVHQDYRSTDYYERSHPDALLEAVDPDDLASFTRQPRGLRRGVTNPRDLPKWLPEAKMGDPSSEFVEKSQQLEQQFHQEEGQRLHRDMKDRDYEERWRPRRWNDLIDYHPQEPEVPTENENDWFWDLWEKNSRRHYVISSLNPGFSRFSIESEEPRPSVPTQGPRPPLDEDPMVARSRRMAIQDESVDDPVARHRRGLWSHEELLEREEQIRRSRARRGPDAPPTREETRQNARLLRLHRGSRLFNSPWAEHTDSQTGVRTYTNQDSNGVTHGISVPLGEEGHYVHETLVTKPQHFKGLNEALLNAMMLEQYLQSRSDEKNQTVQQALGPLIH